MIHASASPIVAYAYLQAEPDAGNVEAGSAYASAENTQVTPASRNEMTIPSAV